MVHDTREQGSTDLAAALRAAASVAVAERRRAGERLDGFGHPQHDADPRVSILLDIAREAGVFGDHCALLLHVEDALAEASGRRIAANIDGVCAALVLDLGLDPQLARVCVLAARVVGLGTHCVEELVQGNRWRHVDSSSVSYVGPTPTPESQR
jgi:citrate synthase